MTILTGQITPSHYQTPISSIDRDKSIFHERTTPEPMVSGDHIWLDLIDDLLRIRSYEDDYDGQGSKSPAPDLVDSAIMLACQMRDHQIPPAQYATAGVNGTIHFEWVDSFQSTDIEVVSPGSAEMCSINLLENSSSLVIIHW